jgi:Mrp family chromosome partitioning ATPase
MAGVHTVLVDCDLRNPEVTNSLCPRVERGLTDLASENYTVEQCILDEEVSGLSILPAPPSRDFTRRTEFAFSPQFSDVLTQLRKRFDLIIMDAPPLIPLTDSRALADHADNIIVTAAWNQTRQDVLAEGLLLLEPNLHRVLGCVLSRVDMDRIRYYDSFYGEAYREPYRPS